MESDSTLHTWWAMVNEKDIFVLCPYKDGKIHYQMYFCKNHFWQVM